MDTWLRTRRFRKTFGAIVVALLLLLFQMAQGQGEWEMRVCAAPSDLPESNKRQEGFQNHILEILADELQAELNYVWTNIDTDAVRKYLRTGECDLIMGIAEGASGLLTTVAYHRAPYVFVYRHDAPFDVESLNDEVLAELRITTFPNSLLHEALAEFGLAQNTVLPELDTLASATDPTATLIQSVLDGETDVAVVYGPDASYVAQQHPSTLKLVPVLPELVPPILPMFRLMAIGVRPNDEALRDRLDIALANRWDDIQSVFDDYSVPFLPAFRPVAPEPSQAESIRIGAVLPTPTGNHVITDVIGQAAQVGALLAEDLVGRTAEQRGVALDVLLASSPSTEAAIRAARRLVTTEGVTALIGGLGKDQALALSEVAEEQNVLFFNIGSPADELREACRSTTFHVEASAAMYLDALASWFADLGHRRVFFVYEGSDEGRALYQRAAETTTSGPQKAREVGKAEIAPGQFTYNDTLEQIRETAPDIILLLLSPEEQEFFLSQYEVEGLTFPITGFPYPVMQTRDFLTRLRQVAPSEHASYRAALWETSLQANGAGALNENFIARSGEPMEPAGWAAYAAVKVVYEAVTSAKTQTASALVDFLERPTAVFDVYKGPGTSFRSWDHQLRQPLYLVKIDLEADWGYAVSERIKLLDLVGELSVSTRGSRRAHLDRLGDGAGASRCRF